MTEKEKMMAFHAMQQIKEAPDYMQDINLIIMCHVDKTGKFEKLARVLAGHKMPTNEIMPCIMDLFQEILCDTDFDGGEKNVLGQGDQVREGIQETIHGE